MPGGRDRRVNRRVASMRSLTWRRYSGWRKAVDAPLLHHQLAKAQFELENAEMYLEKMRSLMRSALGREVSMFERVETRAWHLVFYLGEQAAVAQAVGPGVSARSQWAKVGDDSSSWRRFSRAIRGAAGQVCLEGVVAVAPKLSVRSAPSRDQFGERHATHVLRKRHDRSRRRRAPSRSRS